MNATTAPTAPLPSLDLTKYEGHTPGPWLLANTANGDPWLAHTDSTITYTDTEGEDCFAICWFAPGDPEIFKANAHLITDAPQLLATLLTMQRDRDNANEWAAKHIEAVAHFEDQLAASELTCAELREKLEKSQVAYETEWSQNESLRARAEAAERTVEGLRAGLRAWLVQWNSHDEQVRQLAATWIETHGPELARLEGGK